MTHPTEHPFAPFVRILGKGPNLSRPLTQDEAQQAMTMILHGQAEPAQMGAFLCLLRVRTELPQEIAGMALACRSTFTVDAAAMGADVDWPAWAGKARHLPLFLLAALALGAAGIRIFMHGAEDHTEGRLYAGTALAALGIPAVTTTAQAVQSLGRWGLAYCPLPALSPAMQRVMDLKALLGVRSPLHTAGRLANPSKAPFVLTAVTHPPYLPLHQQAAALLGLQRLATFKGDGGEAERRPEKPCQVLFVENGVSGCEDWPVLVDGTRPQAEELDLHRLPALWSGADDDPAERAAIIGTMAIVLRYTGRCPTIPQALTHAETLWQQRPQSL